MRECHNDEVVRMAQALMDARDENGYPILVLDPDFNELPTKEEMLEDDDFCQEDILALAKAALEFLNA